jgi:nitrate/TMAO reductase-like tetraheme cytochrome c subunit
MKTLQKILACAALALCAIGARAESEASGKYGGEDRGRPVQPAQLNATWQQECAACHMAYPAGLLPAESWRRLMGSLDKHFGTDATLSPAQSAEISAFLTKNASNRWTAKTAPLRITESAWFKAKHRAGEVPADVWKRASVKSPANCQACHSGADKGDFNERGVRIPK